MKSYFKLLMVLVLTLACVIGCVSCNKDKDKDLDIVIPPANTVEDTYIIDFVYVYQRTYINDFDRMESKRYTERVLRVEVPVENEGHR